MSDPPALDLLEEGTHHGLSRAFWAFCAEAAAVMLERFHRRPPPPTRCTILPSGRDEVAVGLLWGATDPNAVASHASGLDATTWGAYAVAVASVRVAGGWRVLGRTQHASGADLIMVREDDEPENFVKLEVSGVGAGPAATLRSRLRMKIDQVQSGDLDRPGVAVVVGFELAHVLISETYL